MGFELLVNNLHFLTLFGGFWGGACMFVYMRPENIPDALVRLTVAVMVSNMLTQLVGAYITKNQSAGELWGVSFLLGFSAWSLFGAMARFFAKRQGYDIVDMARDVKSASGDIKLPQTNKNNIDAPE
jgi:hypothetical protein